MDGHGEDLRLGAQALGKRADELARRETGVWVGEPGSAQHPEERARFGAAEPGEVRARTAEQPPPAAAPGPDVDRNSGSRQCLEVAPGGGEGDLEFGSHLGGRDLISALEEEEEGEKPVCAHGPSLPVKVVRR
ncbi:hypothetical protein JCM18882A_17270 [Brevibacterium metallidurans]|uniref:Uncharacterized protein n=1 Tax=Brevibacterium metallidurans TaxID=1482676 RepID=A0ABP3C679_9MICO